MKTRFNRKLANKKRGNLLGTFLWQIKLIVISSSSDNQDKNREPNNEHSSAILKDDD